MFGQVGQQHCQVEADFFGWVVEALCELHVVNLAIMVAVTAHQQEVDFLSGVGEREEEGSIYMLINFAPAQFFSCHLWHRTTGRKVKEKCDLRGVVLLLLHLLLELLGGDCAILVHVQLLCKGEREMMWVMASGWRANVL